MAEKLSQTVKYYHETKQELLIVKLNQITKGLSDYHHFISTRRIFSIIDHRLWEMLWKLTKGKHPQKSNKWIKKWCWRPKDSR